MPETPRRFADRYRLEAILGRGGMGEVWRGYDERLNRHCAIKVLRIMEDKPSAERFFREARMLASLRDPNVVIIYDYGVDSDRPYLVMELLPGPSLADLVRESGPLSFDQVRRYGAQAAYALQAVHDAGVVHRDVKPGNLVLDQAGNARLVDFGIALGGTAGLEATLTEHGAIIGSAAYLAPEQAVGRRADARSDLYGLGCLLMSLLTGKPPFEDDSPVAILGMHLNDPPPLVSQRRPDVPEDIDQLVDDLLAKNPDARPRSAAEAARRLAGAPAGRPVPPPPLPPRSTEPTVVIPPPPAPPPPGAPPPGARKPSNAGRGALVAVLVVLALAGAVAGWALTRDGGGAEEVEQAQPLPSTSSSRKPPKASATPSAGVPMPTAPSVIDVPQPTWNVVTLAPVTSKPKPNDPQPLPPPAPEPEPEPAPEPEPEPEPVPEPEPEPVVPTAEFEALEKALAEADVKEEFAPDGRKQLEDLIAAARTAAENDKPGDAKAKIDEFIAKVGEFEGTGGLDPEDAQALRDKAEAVRNALK